MKFNSVTIDKPNSTHGKYTTVYPKECRMKKSSYRGRLMAQLSWSLDGQRQTPFDKNLGDIPIMVSL